MGWGVSIGVELMAVILEYGASSYFDMMWLNERYLAKCYSCLDHSACISKCFMCG